MKQHTILLVDDNADILDVLQSTLQEDYQVLKACNAQDALETLSANQVDLIITDQRMPGMTGIEFLEKTLAYNPRMVKIILTGYTDTKDLMDAINQGRVYKYITKPFRPRETARISDVFTDLLGGFEQAFWGPYNYLIPEETLEDAMKQFSDFH